MNNIVQNPYVDNALKIVKDLLDGSSNFEVYVTECNCTIYDLVYKHEQALSSVFLAGASVVDSIEDTLQCAEEILDDFDLSEKIGVECMDLDTIDYHKYIDTANNVPYKNRRKNEKIRFVLICVK